VLQMENLSSSHLLSHTFFTPQNAHILMLWKEKFFSERKKTEGEVAVLWNCFWNEEGTLDSAYKNIIFFLIIPYLLLLPFLRLLALRSEDLTFRDAIGRNKNKFHEHGISSLLLCFFVFVLLVEWTSKNFIDQ
jgi:hypothetical protein